MGTELAARSGAGDAVGASAGDGVAGRALAGTRAVNSSDPTQTCSTRTLGYGSPDAGGAVTSTGLTVELAVLAAKAGSRVSLARCTVLGIVALNAVAG